MIRQKWINWIWKRTKLFDILKRRPNDRINVFIKCMEHVTEPKQQHKQQKPTNYAKTKLCVFQFQTTNICFLYMNIITYISHIQITISSIFFVFNSKIVSINFHFPTDKAPFSRWLMDSYMIDYSNSISINHNDSLWIRCNLSVIYNKQN